MAFSMLRAAQLLETYQIRWLPNFKSLLEISLTVGNLACDSVPPHVVSVRVLHAIFPPGPFWGQSVLSGQRCMVQTPTENSKWIPAVRMIYGVYTLYGTHQTRFTQLVMFDVSASPLDTIWALLSLSVFYREIFTDTERKRRRSLVTVLVHLGYTGTQGSVNDVQCNWNT